MRFSQDFWLHIKENDDSHLHSKFEAHLVKYLLNWQNKNYGISPIHPSIILFDDPHTQTTPPNFTPYASKDA